jgi:hypothetical protein
MPTTRLYEPLGWVLRPWFYRYWGPSHMAGMVAGTLRGIAPWYGAWYDPCSIHGIMAMAGVGTDGTRLVLWLGWGYPYGWLVRRWLCQLL